MATENESLCLVVDDSAEQKTKNKLFDSSSSSSSSSSSLSLISNGSITRSINKSTPVPENSVNSDIWSGVDSRIMLFITQIFFSFIAIVFGMFLVINNNGNEGYLSAGMSIIMYILGFMTKSPVMKKKAR